MFANRLRPLAQRSLRHFAAASAPSSKSSGGVGVVAKTAAATLACGTGYMGLWIVQHNYGDAHDWFDQRFITRKDPDALAEFYQAEDLLRIIAVIPPMFSFFMNKVVPDEKEQTEETCLLNTEETKFNVRLLGMEVSFQLLEEEEEIDGETVLTSFCRYERFVDWVPLLADLGFKYRLWDQTWRYGFTRLEDGSYEVYHKCEEFLGPWPIRIIVWLHQSYVLWGCEKVINGPNFGTEDLDALDEELACVPWNEFKKFVGVVKVAKEEEVAELMKAEKPDENKIAEAKAALEQISRVEASKESLVSVSKRAYPVSGPNEGRTASIGKLVAHDKDAAAVLGSVMKDPALKRSASVAMQKLVSDTMADPKAEWQQRTMSKRSNSVKRTLSRKPSVAPGLAKA